MSDAKLLRAYQDGYNAGGKLMSAALNPFSMMEPEWDMWLAGFSFGMFISLHSNDLRTMDCFQTLFGNFPWPNKSS